MSKKAHRRANKKFRTGICPICHKFFHNLTEHHILKRAVWGDNDETIFICRKCHDLVEAEVSQRERTLLMKHKIDIYEDAYEYIKNKG
jgi:RNase P subunit RPR2